MTHLPCVRIGHLRTFEHLLPVIAGHTLGQAGRMPTRLTLDFIVMNAWPPIRDGLLNGDIDGAFIPSPMAMDLFSRGLDIRIVMAAHRSDSLILKNRSIGIKTLDDFKGKTVLVPAELCLQTMLLHRLLSSTGLRFGTHDDPTADVVREIVPSCFMEAVVTADDDGDIAGWIAEEPFGSHAVQTGRAGIVCTTGHLWQNHPGSVLVLDASLMVNHAPAVDQLLSLFVETGRFLRDNPDHVLSFLTRTFPDQNEPDLRRLLSGTDTGSDPDRFIPDRDALSAIHNYMTAAMGTLERAIDLNRLTDPTFILRTLSDATV